MNLPNSERFIVVSPIRLRVFAGMIDVVESFSGDRHNWMLNEFELSSERKCRVGPGENHLAQLAPARTQWQLDHHSGIAANIFQIDVNIAVIFDFDLFDAAGYGVPLILRRDLCRPTGHAVVS